MSKGRRCRLDKEKEKDLLREVNVELIARMKEMERQIEVLREENTQISDIAVMKSERYEMENSSLKEEMEKRDAENADLKRELQCIEDRYNQLEASSIVRERSMMLKICDIEKRSEESLLLHMLATAALREENGAMEEKITRLVETGKEERRVWKERVGALENTMASLEKAVEAAQEERQRAENSCLVLRRNNKVLAMNIHKEDVARQKMEEDLRESRQAIEALKRSKYDADVGNEERKRLEDLVKSLEGGVRELERDLTCTKIKFENLKESGAWTGVLLSRQDDRIRHLTESLLEERGRVHDINLRMEKCMDHLAAERKEKDAVMADLNRAHQESNDLSST